MGGGGGGICGGVEGGHFAPALLLLLLTGPTQPSVPLVPGIGELVEVDHLIR